MVSSSSSMPSPGFCGTSIMPSTGRSGSIEQVGAQRIVHDVVLEIGAVAQRGDDVQRGGHQDVGRPAVRDHPDAARVGGGSDPKRLRDSADPRHVGLDDPEPAPVHEVDVGPERRLLLARRDGRGREGGEARKALEIVGGQRLLEEVDAVVGEAAAQPDRVLEGGREAEIDHDVRAVADRTAHLADGGDRLPDVVAEPAPAELHGLVAARHVLLRELHHALGRAGIEVARIDREGGPAGAAQQAVDRLAHGLAQDVPERDVDAREHVHAEAAPAVGLRALVEPVPEPVDVERVLADEQALHAARGDRQQRRLDDGLGGRRVGVHLADAGDALVGVDLDDQDALAAVADLPDLGQAEDDRLDIGDQHPLPLVPVRWRGQSPGDGLPVNGGRQREMDV